VAFVDAAGSAAQAVALSAVSSTSMLVPEIFFMEPPR
jgi:hypothetical protein